MEPVWPLDGNPWGGCPSGPHDLSPATARLTSCHPWASSPSLNSHVLCPQACFLPLLPAASFPDFPTALTYFIILVTLVFYCEVGSIGREAVCCREQLLAIVCAQLNTC